MNDFYSKHFGFNPEYQKAAGMLLSWMKEGIQLGLSGQNLSDFTLNKAAEWIGHHLLCGYKREKIK